MRRSRIVLLAALVLLALAAWLMTGAERVKRKPRLEVNFPTELRPQERARLEQRRREAVKRPSVVAAPADPSGAAPTPVRSDLVPERPRDPIIAALPPASDGRSVLVLEANAFLNSPVGGLLLGCLAKGRGGSMEELSKEFGLDLTRDVDRVALMGDTVAISGHFGALERERFAREAAERRPIGDRGELYVNVARDQDEAGVEHETRSYTATWGDDMILVSESEEELRATIDRLEGRGASGPPAISEEETYGDLYGVLSAKDLAELLPEDEGLATRLREAASSATIHADASSDVAISGDLTGDDPEKVQELGKAIGAALSIGRLAAKAQGRDAVAELLEYARVSPADGSLQLEMALPLAYLEKTFAKCGEVAAPATPGTTDAR